MVHEVGEAVGYGVELVLEGLLAPALGVLEQRNQEEGDYGSEKQATISRRELQKLSHNHNMDEQEFSRLFPVTSNRELAKTYSVSPFTIIRWARRLGLQKDAVYRSQISKKNRISKPAPRGEKHYNWKGGKPWERFKDPRYQVWRTAVLERDDYVCQDCKRRCKKYEKGLAAHHIQPYKDHEELRYEVSNGITLCKQCHLARHGRPPAPRKPVPCACGCGTMIAPIDLYGRPRRYVNHHARKGQKQPASAKQKLSKERKGKKLTPEHRAKIAAGLRNSAKRIGRPPKPR